MRKIADTMGGDAEMAHGAMDDLMCEVLRSLGFAGGVAIFEQQVKWYA
ncbi:hypothetical protein [Burkholderia pseudomallei]|nr:hypothetical protein [Burkholderia pseudomallei]